MAAPSRPSFLARSTLLKMGARIAVIIALTTVFSYLHMYRSLRGETLLRLKQYVSERSQREEAIFVLAEDNHVLLKEALGQRILALRQEDPSARFDRLFEQRPDGTIRNRSAGFDGTRMPGVFIPRGVAVDAELRQWILAAYDVLTQHAPTFHLRFTNTYITLPGGAIVLYWPERPTWCQEAEPGFNSAEFEFFTISTPQSNPGRRTAWTGVFKDPVAAAWIVSVSTPVDVANRHAATISHDIFIDELMARARSERLSGAYNLILRDDGQLIAHPELSAAGATTAYNILSDAGDPQTARIESPQRRAHLRSLFERLRSRPPEQAVLELPEHSEYLAVARLKGTGWNLVTVMGMREVSLPALLAARYVLLLGVASLLVELIIMYWVLKQQITRPLLSLTRAADQVASGSFKLELETSQTDELGRLAQGFQAMAHELQRREVALLKANEELEQRVEERTRELKTMAHELQQREEALRQVNEGLEQRVEERTQELKKTHQTLVETARMAGMAEVATNVLHNVGNVLNSVHTAARLAKERLGRLRLENVGRVASLLEERKDDLAVFLTQEERGRSVPSYLKQLGEQLQKERQDIFTLLDDVNRYTDHIGTVVRMQQSYARTPRMSEPTQLAEVLEDALRMEAASLARHGVKVERQLAPLPPLLIDRHKVLTILINLINNARYALDAAPEGERLLLLKLEAPVEGRLRLEVRDNGMGIAPEALARIFQHGFTTRREGHGFGLHSCVQLAQQMDGALSVHSDGPGRGATFTLELPYHPV